MTDSHAVAAVTDTLIEILQKAVGYLVPGAQVDSRPLDEVANEQGIRVLNVFLYQVAVDGAHRNEDRYGLRPGESAPPSLPLVLHYLLTPYVSDDADNEVVGHRMLGAAMSRLHDQPVLRRADIAGAAPYSDLHQQVERVRLTPAVMSVDEISKLWTAFQTRYRISAAYEARVVLVDSGPATTALPVLRRGPDDAGPGVVGSATSPYPSLAAAVAPGGRDTASPGEQVRLEGANLAGTPARARLSHRLLADPVEVPATVVGRTQAEITVPDQPAGLWSVSMVLAGDGAEQVTNEVPLAVAPRVASPLPMAVARDDDGGAVIDLTCAPPVRPGQQVWLLLGDRHAVAEPISVATDAVTFRFAQTPAGRHRLRLRVDGVDSPLVDRSVTPPAFDEDQAVILT